MKKQSAPARRSEASEGDWAAWPILDGPGKGGDTKEASKAHENAAYWRRPLKPHVWINRTTKMMQSKRLVK